MKVITIIGADACGKDTQINLLKEHFSATGKSVQVVSIWDSLSDFQEIEDKKTLQKVVETILLRYEPHARSFFLLACLKNSISKVKNETDVVLLNGYFHKYWASELTYGVDSNIWANTINSFLKSDSYIYLNTPVQICLKRRTKWSNYEQGAGKKINHNQFTLEEFQTNLHQNLDRIISSMKERVHQIDGSKSEKEVFTEILKLV